MIKEMFYNLVRKMTARGKVRGLELLGLILWGQCISCCEVLSEIFQHANRLSFVFVVFFR